nr:hypothetical protein BaRGS_033340 [Batillaria attramentaria]
MLGGAGLGSAVKPGGQDTSTVGITERDPYTIRETFVVRPPDLPPPPEQVMLNTGRPHRLERGLWMHVFSFLRPSDLAHCLQVCKAWNRWAIHHSLWPSINLARTNIKQTHLCGSVLRQPRSLDLTNAAISYKQLAWLVARLPQLKELSLSGQPWATISALCSPNTPLLRSLTVSWATGIQPACFEELIEPPVGVKPGLTPSLSRLHQLRYLDLSGTEINDSSLELISAHLPLLEVLNLTCCMRITDAGLEALACQGRPLLLSLQALCLVRCLGLTDKCLPPLANLQRLRSLNLSKIPHISRTACSRFLQQYSYRQLSMTVPGIFSVVD